MIKRERAFFDLSFSLSFCPSNKSSLTGIESAPFTCALSSPLKVCVPLAEVGGLTAEAGVEVRQRTKQSSAATDAAADGKLLR